MDVHGIIVVYRSPLDTKAPGPPLICLVGPLAIWDLHIDICVGSPNTLLWSNFIYYTQTHQFEAIALSCIKTCVIWFWENFDWDWQTETET